MAGFLGGSRIKRSKVYNSPGTYTFTVPVGIAGNSSGTFEVYVTSCGAGGGGGGANSGALFAGGTGGITSFGTLLSLIGGGGAGTAVTSSGSGGGAGTNGGTGGVGFGYGGGGLFSFTPGIGSTYSNGSKGLYGSGGSGGIYTSSYAAPGGGAGDFVIEYPLAVTPGQAYTITIGTGGIGGSGSSSNNGGAGGNGYMLIEWWE